MSESITSFIKLNVRADFLQKFIGNPRKSLKTTPRSGLTTTPRLTLSLPTSRWSCSHPRPVSPEQVFVGPFGCFWKILLLRKWDPRLWPWGFGRWFLGGPFWKDSLNNPCFEFAKDLAEKGKSHKKILVQRDFQTSWAFRGSPLHSIIIIGMLPNPCENVRHRGWEGNPGNPGLLHRHIALHRKTTLQEPVLSSKNYRGNIFREGKHIHFSIDSDFMTPMTPFF